MSTDNPYNSLGQILAMGGEQSLAKLVWQGASESKIAALFLSRFEPMTPADREALQEFSESMVEAGETISSLPLDEPLDPSLIPLNSFLYGPEAGGRRVRFAFEVELEEIERRISILYDFPDIPSLTELFDVAEMELADRANDSPGAFGVVNGEVPTIKNIIIPYAERRF